MDYSGLSEPIRDRSRPREACPREGGERRSMSFPRWIHPGAGITLGGAGMTPFFLHGTSLAAFAPDQGEDCKGGEKWQGPSSDEGREVGKRVNDSPNGEHEERAHQACCEATQPCD